MEFRGHVFFGHAHGKCDWYFQKRIRPPWNKLKVLNRPTHHCSPPGKISGGNSFISLPRRGNHRPSARPTPNRSPRAAKQGNKMLSAYDNGGRTQFDTKAISKPLAGITLFLTIDTISVHRGRLVKVIHSEKVRSSEYDRKSSAIAWLSREPIYRVEQMQETAYG